MTHRLRTAGFLSLGKQPFYSRHTDETGGGSDLVSGQGISGVTFRVCWFGLAFLSVYPPVPKDLPPESHVRENPSASRELHLIPTHLRVTKTSDF